MEDLNYIDFSNEKIAKLIAAKLYGPSLSATEFAFQLFVEKIVCPEDCSSYTETDMENWIVEFLNKK